VLGFFDYRRTLKRLAAHTDLSGPEMYAAICESALGDAYESGRMSSAEFLTGIRALCRLRCSDEVLSEAWSDIFHPNVEVCGLVTALKPRYRLLLGSNTNELHSRWFRRQFADTLQHFDHLVLSHEIGVCKPDAGFFEHCLGHAGAEAEECLFIDDLPANIAGARACGWQGIVYRSFEDLQHQLRELGVLLTIDN
jgi:FMN phosphatase YigB (HAD superfamily)